MKEWTPKQREAILRVIASRQIYMTPADAAEIEQSNPQTVRDACRSGTAGYASVTRGNETRIVVADFFRYWGIPFETPEAWNVYETRRGKEGADREDDYRRYAGRIATR